MTLQTTWNNYLSALLAELPTLAAQVAMQARERVQAALGNKWDGGQRQHLLAVVHVLRAESRTFADGLTAALSRQVDGLQKPEAPGTPAASRPVQLSLVDDKQLERDIELARVIQLIESSAEWELRELQAVCATLKQARSILPEHVPLRPAMCAHALLSTLEDAGLTHEASVLALRVSGPGLANALRDLYAQHARLLSRLGIPAQRFQVQVTPPKATDPARDDALHGLVARMAGRVHRRNDGASLSEHTAVAPSGDTLPAPLIPRLLERIADQAEMGTTMRALLARLHAPVVRAAAVEAGAMMSLDHPVWRLIDLIASLSSVNDDAGAGAGGLTTLAKLLEPIVVTLEQAERPSAAVFEDALSRVGEVPMQLHSAHLSSVSQLDIDLTQALQRTDLAPVGPAAGGHDDVDSTLRRQVAAQLRGSTAPPPLRQFLLGPWVIVMSRAITRHGARSDETVRWQNAVGDFIRHGEETAPVRKRQQASTALLETATQGMRSAEIPPHQMQASLAELRTVLLDATPASARVGGSADQPPPTVPMDMVDTGTETPAKQDREAWLTQLVPGDLCRLFIQGRWMNAQLTWRSSNGQFCVFASRHGGRLHSLTRRQLARLRAEGLATTIARGQQVRDAVDTLTMDFDASDR